jgi:tetratricopeptide (TPR) repeat protein
MDAMDRYSPEDVQRILGLTSKQLDYWDRLRLVSPQKEEGARYYDFRGLIGLRTIKQLLEKGVSASRLQKAVSALNEKLAQVQTPLSQLRILSDGKDVLVEQGAARLEPVSGQFVLNFETRELDERVRVIGQARSAEEWLAMALSYEADRQTRAQAIEAYDHCVDADPKNVGALLNCGTLYYEDGDFEKAANYFQRALVADGQSALAHFNLGSVLEEMGEVEKAREHLRQAVRLDPSYCDAHFNLAFVCEKLRAFPEAREHWQTYVKLDPVGPWATYARLRLAAGGASKSATIKQ